jgi:hypothetical protein
MAASTETQRVLVDLWHPAVRVHDTREGGDWADEAAQTQLPDIPGLAEVVARGIFRHYRLEWPPVAPVPWVDFIHIDAEVAVRLRLARPEGDKGPRRTQLEIRPRDPSGDLPARMVRRVEQSHLLDFVDYTLKALWVSRELDEGWRRRVHRPGRSGQSDDYYLDWGIRYVALLDSGCKTPIKALVEEEKAAGRHVTAGQIRGYLGKLRERHLLTEAPPGRPGGEWTAKARKILGAGRA